MPLHEYFCQACDSTATRYTNLTPHDFAPPCNACAQPTRYAGLSMCVQRSHKPTGAVLPGGKFVEGTWHHAPRRRRRNVKTFK